jgi:hypothetical protein
MFGSEVRKGFYQTHPAGRGRPDIGEQALYDALRALRDQGTGGLFLPIHR